MTILRFLLIFYCAPGGLILLASLLNLVLAHTAAGPEAQVLQHSVLIVGATGVGVIGKVC